PDEYPPSRSPPPQETSGYQHLRESAKNPKTSVPGTRLPHAVHGGEELLVALGLLELVEEELHRLDRIQLRERLAQQPDLLELVLLEQELFLPGAGLLDVDRREDALVHEASVQVHLHVAGALELFEDHVIHPAAGVDDRAALPLADRTEQIHDEGREVLGIVLESEPLHRVERREVVEKDLLARLVRRLEVDRLDLEEREVPLRVLRRTDLAGDGVAGAQVEASYLGGGNVDIVRPRQVVVVGGAEEPEAIRQDLEHALGEDETVLLGLGLEDLEDELLLPEPAQVLDVQIAGDLIQLGDASLLQLRQVHAVHLRIRRRASLGSLSAGAHLRAPGAASNRRMP